MKRRGIVLEEAVADVTAPQWAKHVPVGSWNRRQPRNGLWHPPGEVWGGVAEFDPLHYQVRPLFLLLKVVQNLRNSRP